MCTHIAMYTYIYMLWCYYLGQVWPFEVLLSGPSLLFTKHCLSKNTINIRGFSTFFLKKYCARKFEVLLSGPSWPFLSCSQIGPDNNTSKCIFFQFFAFENVLKYLFYSVFCEHQPKFGKNGQKKDNFSHFPKHRFIKKTHFVATPLLTKNWCFSTLFFETKNIDVEQKHNLKSGESKDKKKGLERKSKTGNQKKEKIFQENRHCN